MVYLDGKWQFYPAVLFVESSPVKQRDGIVAAAGIRMGNMGKDTQGERENWNMSLPMGPVKYSFWFLTVSAARATYSCRVSCMSTLTT